MNQEKLTREQLSQFEAPEPPRDFADKVLGSLPPARLVSPFFWVGLAAAAAILLFFFVRYSDTEKIALSPVKIQPKDAAPAAGLVVSSTTSPSVSLILKEPTSTIEVYSREAAIELYHKGKFSDASIAALSMTPPDKKLAAQIDEFSRLYIPLKAGYAAGERETLYEPAKKALALDQLIMRESVYQLSLAAILAESADARALKLYKEGSRAPINRAKLQAAYTAAMSAIEAETIAKMKLTKNSSVIAMAIKKDADAEFAKAEKALKSSKYNEALKHCENIMELMPSRSIEYTKASDLRRSVIPAIGPM